MYKHELFTGVFKSEFIPGMLSNTTFDRLAGAYAEANVVLHVGWGPREKQVGVLWLGSPCTDQPLRDRSGFVSLRKKAFYLIKWALHIFIPFTLDVQSIENVTF